MSPAPRAHPDGDPLRERIAREVEKAARAAHLAPPVRDGRLDSVANDVARGTPGEQQPSFELVAFLLSHYGIVEPEPQILFVRGGPHAEDAAVDLVRPQVPSILRALTGVHLGVGLLRNENEVVVVLAFQQQALELKPVPRALAPGLVGHLEGRLLGGYHSPKVIVTGPSGTVTQARVEESHGRFESAVSCRRDQTGVLQVEISGDDERGPAMLANFPVYCGVPPLSRSPAFVAETGEREEPEQAEESLLDLLNRDRAAHRLSPLRLDRRLTSVARAHSREMASTGVVAHVSPRTGNVADRLKRVGLEPQLAAENVGRAGSASQAERGFMSSPGHRANILDPIVTTVGIGVAAGPEENGAFPLYFTQIFTTRLP